MNPVRVARIHRERAAALAELARLEGELAEEYSVGEAPANDVRPVKQTRKRRRATVPLMPADVTDTDVEAARVAARKRGIQVS